MKTFVCVLLLAALVAAEPPRFRQTFRFGRQEVEEDNKESAKSESGDAPYPASGFKPTKEFNLPSRQELTPPSTAYGVPDTSYSAPLSTYSAPQTEYGVPKSGEEDGEESNKKEEDNDSETVESADSNGKSEKKEKSGKKEKENLEESPKNDAVISGQGVYYVLLPGSQLQRVQFQTVNDLANMAYTARLQYKNEDRAPIYLYNPVPQYQTSAAAYYQAPSAAYYQPSAAYYQW
ncbi:uncharacterized protein LOC113229818 [Hyposmocoma kahamanoa]|uniref:uncharacterized protein LOC113229818 n=1 Tax=Hyposmocoma kahamanoa TaxID=1477025 RepID=UPI000E6D6892|nr:uncharacterized protein LOC113229818 [Hyposmocoma kahamanoa]